MPDLPLSIVLCFRNPGARLAAALRSLTGQDSRDWELILVDGASTDGSRDLIPADLLARWTLISEPDQGVYDAMNKALRVARGEWVYFMGADDRLADDGLLSRILPALGASTAQIVSGEVRYSDGRIYAGRLGRPVARNFLHHQGSFYRRSLLGALGGFDTRFRIQADYDLNLRALAAGVEHGLLPWRVSECGCGGLSDCGSWDNYHEEVLVRHRHFPVWSCLPWDLVTMLRYLRKQLLRRLRKRPE